MKLVGERIELEKNHSEEVNSDTELQMPHVHSHVCVLGLNLYILVFKL